MNDVTFGNEYETHKAEFVALGISKETYVKTRRVDEGMETLVRPKPPEFSASATYDQSVKNACQLAGKPHLADGFIVNNNSIEHVIEMLAK